MITISIDMKAVLASLTDDHLEAIGAGGALDPESVLYEYVTQHDDRVRPSHAALDGTVWRVGDPLAPVPPISWGCRCYMRYQAKPGTTAARVLPPAEAAPVTKAEAFASHLDTMLPTWSTLAKAAAKQPADLRFSFLVNALRATEHRSDARDLAMMILEASTVKA